MFEEGGAVQLRHHMNSVIINLEYILLSRELERAATYDEWVESVESLDIGLGRDDMDPAPTQGYQYRKQMFDEYLEKQGWVDP